MQQQQQQQTELELDLRTTYAGTLPPPGGKLKGFVEIRLKAMMAQSPIIMTYMVLMDKSSSMADGARYPNTLNGFRALNAMLPPGTPLVAIPFNQTVEKTYGPLPAPLDDGLVAEICHDLRPAGGTNIGIALSKAYGMAAELLRQDSDNRVTILLMTDGEDAKTHRLVHDFIMWDDMPPQDGLLMHTIKTMGVASSVFLCVVGICHDASASLLGQLAEIGGGTYTITKDADIAGLVGSLVALVGERLHEKVVLTCQGVIKEPGMIVHLCKSKPTRVPFAVPVGEITATAEEAVRIVCTVSTTTTTTELVRTLVVSGVMGAVDRECVLMDFERVLQDHQLAMAKLTASGDWRAAELITRNTVEEVAALKLEYASTMPLLLAGDIIVIKEIDEALAKSEADVAQAQRDHDAARELSHRMASEASTARNAGMSIGGGRFESASQASMRSQSASMTFPFSSSA